MDKKFPYFEYKTIVENNLKVSFLDKKAPFFRFELELLNSEYKKIYQYIWDFFRFVSINTDYFYSDINEKIGLTDFDFDELDLYLIKNLNILGDKLRYLKKNYQKNEAMKLLAEFYESSILVTYIDLTYKRIYSDYKTSFNTLIVFKCILTKLLKTLDVFMPCIKEYILDKSNSLYFNKKIESKNNGFESGLYSFIFDLSNEIRHIREFYKIPLYKKISFAIYSKNREEYNKEIVAKYLKEAYNLEDIEYLDAHLRKKYLDIKYLDNKIFDEKILSVVFLNFKYNIEIILPLKYILKENIDDLDIDIRLENADKEINRLETLLSNSDFLSKAPKDLIDKEIKKLNKIKENRLLLFILKNCFKFK